ncbi:golgin subfamily A member 6-like protein 22 [Takifugu flavidus]|uniref:golgin subfamily A member 6-like protein 22 n=1 Tax=Takifugu flavidus TaxID=433684 RepID=UPI002544C025|nr:golgin subfamily A member 6-like protein 22 [Takifugu flavidus]
MEKIQEENKKLLRSVTELQHEVRQLKEQLVEKDEQLSQTIKRRQIKTVAHVDTLNQLNQARADLTVSQERCTYLEEKLQKGTNHSHQSPEHGDHVRGQQPEEVVTCMIELSKKEEALKLQFFQKEQQMEAWMRQRIISMQEELHKKLLEEREKNQREMTEREERLRQQLERGMREERDDCLKKQLSTFIESWQTEAQQWKKHQLELQEKLQEQESLRKQQEEERKQESECIQENFQQLWNYIEKKEKKKKKKGVWSRILKFWKK